MKKELKVYFRDKGILAERFFQIKRSLGIMNDTKLLLEGAPGGG